jgi:hypothetical protein
VRLITVFVLLALAMTAVFLCSMPFPAAGAMPRGRS